MTTQKPSTSQPTALCDLFEELETMDRSLHTAALAILEQCDLLSHSASTHHADAYTIAVTNITQNCAFHDLNSQRIHKIHEGLVDLIQNLQARGVDLPRSILPEGRLASGPSREKDALSQEDVEALLNA